MVWEMWLKFVFFGEITLPAIRHPESVDEAGSVRTLSMASSAASASESLGELDHALHLLLDCHHFGRIFQCPKFQDAITDSIIALSNDASPHLPPFQLVKRVFKITTPMSGLRKLFSTILRTETWPVDWKDQKIAAKEMGWGAWAALQDAEDDEVWSLRSGRTSRQGVKEASWRSGGCRFHEHPAAESGACRERTKEWI